MRYQTAALVLLGVLAAYTPITVHAQYSSPAPPATPSPAAAPSPAATPSPATRATPSPGAARVIPITLAEFRFVPNAITVKAGRPIVLRLSNKGTVTHEFVAPTLFAAARGVAVSGAELEEGEEVHVAKGKTVTIRLTPTRTGTFRFWCGERFKGKLHRDLGMRGIITVTR